MRARGTWRMTSLAVCIALLSGPAAWGAPAEGEKPPGERPSGPESAAAKVERMLAGAQERITQLQTEEFQLTMNVMTTQQKAAQGLKEPGKAAEQLSQGKKSKDLLEYRAALISCAQMYQSFDGRYYSLVRTVQGMEKEREGLPADLKTRVTEVSTKVNAKHRTNLEKIANLYEMCAEWQGALGFYLQIYQGLSEGQRAKDRRLREKIADLYEKMHDYRNATAMYKNIMDGIPEKDRLKDRGLCEKLGNLYEKMGDPKSALTLYKAALEAIPADKRNQDGGNLRKKIGEIEKKLNPPKVTPLTGANPK